MMFSIEPSDRIYITGYGFLSFAKSLSKNFSSKYGQKFLDSAKRSTMDAIKTASKRAIQKPAEASDHLIGNIIADKITSFSKTFSVELRSAELHSKNNSTNNETETSKKDISSKKTTNY